MNRLASAKHREQLIAAWASTWLVNHYIEIYQEDPSVFSEIRLINDLIEKPLRKYVGKIRAEDNGIYYYNQTVGI